MGNKINRKTKIFALLALLIAPILLTGCSIGTSETTKLRDLDFTIVSEDRLPDELKAIIEEKKTAEFKTTYNDDQYLYICIGYGEQATGGYSIAVNDLYLTDNAIYASTSLLGPGQADKNSSSPSYPYVVIKTEYLDKTVVFE